MDLVQAVKANDLELVVRLLLEPDVDVNMKNYVGITPLLAAVTSLYLDKIEIGRRLIESGTNVNLANVHGVTPLMSAVCFNRPDFVDLLLKCKDIDINLQDTEGKTALYRSAYRHDSVLMKQLLEAGANPNITDKDGVSPLGRLLQKEDLTEQVEIELADLLIKYGANVNHKNDDGNTVLILAVINLDLTTVRYLLTVPEIDVDVADVHDQTPLMWAVWTSSVLVHMLLDAGADPFMRFQPNQTIARNSKIVRLLRDAERHWCVLVRTAVTSLIQKMIIGRRFNTGSKYISDHIIRLAEYNHLRTTPCAKPSLIALAMSLNIQVDNKTKTQLCKDIAEKLII